MKELITLIVMAVVLPLIIFPSFRFSATRYRRDRRKRLVAKLIMLLLVSAAVAAFVSFFRRAGVTGNAVLIIAVAYAYGIYVMARQRYG